MSRPRASVVLALCGLGGVLASSALAYQVAPPANGGTISGHVHFEGTPPAVASIPATKNPDVCGKTVPDPNATIVDAKTHGVEWAVVSLENVPAGKAPADEYALANQGCAFHPHVLAAAAGETFVLENKDAVIHNTHIRIGSRTLLNDGLSFHEGEAMYHPVKDKRVLARAGLLKVNCDVHGWMSGYVDVLDNPYFAVTDRDGAFTIGDVPPGTYTAHVWHENLGEQTASVTVAAGGGATLDFTFPKK